MSEVHTNGPLTNISIGFIQQESDFAAREFFPIVPSANQSNTYYEYDRTQWFRTEAARRGPGAASVGSGWDVAPTTFTVLRDAVHKKLDDPTVANADVALPLAADASRFVTRQLLLRMEIRFAAAYWATGIWTNDTTPGVTWDDAASTPIEDIKTRARAMLTATGYRPNKLGLGLKVFDDLSDHPDIMDRIKYTGSSGNPAIADQVAMAQLFRVNSVEVLAATNNTAAEGATAVNAQINGERQALLAYASPNPGLFQPSAGYTFVWNQAPGVSNNLGFRIKQWRDEKYESDIIEGEIWYSQNVVAASLGEFFDGAVAA